MSNQEKRQQSVRASTGTAYSYEGDWMALFGSAGITSGTFNDRMLAWINAQLSSAYTNINDAMRAFAVSQGVTNWNELGTFTAGNSPSLSLDFTTGSLDSLITFSRPSLATMYDSTGKLTYAPNNLLTYSNTFNNAAWTNASNAFTLTTGVSDPFGGTNATTLTATASSSTFYQSYSTTVGVTFINSIYIRRRTGTGTIYFRYPNNTNRDVTSEVSSTWTRISSSIATAGTLSYFVIVLATSGDAVDIAFGQAEAVTYQTTPSTYVATTASAYYGPRFDYDPSTLAARGLLTEEARSNLFLQSGAGTNAAWATSNVTPTISGTSIQGTSTLSLLSKTSLDTAVAYHQQGPFTVASGATVTHWRILKAGNNASPAMSIYDTAHHQAVFNLSGSGSVSNVESGVTASCTSLGNSFYLCSMTYTITGTSVYGTLWISGRNGVNGVSGDSVYFDVGQLEVGSFATSYIPTGSSSVARSADSVSMTGTNFSSWFNASAGTFVIEGTTRHSISSAYIINAWDGTSNNRHSIYQGSTSFRYHVNFGGSPEAQFSDGNISGSFKGAVAYATDDFAISANGGAVTTDVSGALPSGTNELWIGSYDSSTAFFNGWIKSISYYRSRLSNTRLQALTA